MGQASYEADSYGCETVSHSTHEICSGNDIVSHKPPLHYVVNYICLALHLIITDCEHTAALSHIYAIFTGSIRTWVSLCPFVYIPPFYCSCLSETSQTNNTLSASHRYFALQSLLIKANRPQSGFKRMDQTVGWVIDWFSDYMLLVLVESVTVSMSCGFKMYMFEITD